MCNLDGIGGVGGSTESQDAALLGPNGSLIPEETSGVLTSDNLIVKSSCAPTDDGALKAAALPYLCGDGYVSDITDTKSIKTVTGDTVCYSVKAKVGCIYVGTAETDESQDAVNTGTVEKTTVADPKIFKALFGTLLGPNDTRNARPNGSPVSENASGLSTSDNYIVKSSCAPTDDDALKAAALPDVCGDGFVDDITEKIITKTEYHDLITGDKVCYSVKVRVGCIYVGTAETDGTGK